MPTLSAIIAVSTSQSIIPSSIDYGKSLDATISEGQSSAINPAQLNLDAIYNQSIAQSTSSAYAPSIRKIIYIVPEVAESISGGVNPSIYTEITEIINAVISESKSNGIIPSLLIQGSMTITQAISKSLSEGIMPEIRIGYPAIINSVISISQSNMLIPNLPFNIVDHVDYGDDVYLLVQDHNGNIKYYKGIVRNRTPQNRMLSVKAILGDGILSERILKENYDEQDIGLTVKEFIDTYCAPITTDNVNTEIDILAPIQAKDKTALSVLENLRRQYDIYYFVDNKWDLHFDTRDNIKGTNWDDEDNRTGYKVKLGDN